MALYTSGYEGLAIEDFLARMRKAKIELVVDVRALPLSRKPGFSKNSFADHLAKAGIRYAHRGALGTPKPIRARYKRDHDFAALRVEFEKYLAHEDDAIAELIALIGKTRACLVCFEADPALCHRTIVAEHVRQQGGPKALHLK
jgi:uncharacterized protein (DUF488 family)